MGSGYVMRNYSKKHAQALARSKSYHRQESRKKKKEPQVQNNDNDNDNEIAFPQNGIAFPQTSSSANQLNGGRLREGLYDIDRRQRRQKGQQNAT